MPNTIKHTETSFNFGISKESQVVLWPFMKFNFKWDITNFIMSEYHLLQIAWRKRVRDRERQRTRQREAERDTQRERVKQVLSETSF